MLVALSVLLLPTSYLLYAYVYALYLIANPTKTFSPIKIRGVTIKNRVVVSPMCQYSSEDGFFNDHHFRHLTTFGVGGAGLVVFEATAVLPNGRISPQCTGIWKDEHIAPMKRIVDYLHTHGVTAALQIAHAGRKASCYSPFQGHDGAIPEAEGGWPNDVVGPSTVKFLESYAQPRALTVAEIKEYQQAYVAAVLRAEQAGMSTVFTYYTILYMIIYTHSTI
jgi:2,4-dienoyl-CoA reductase-like NADH-dependent reductase (Old Yellow Enzyme family)